MLFLTFHYFRSISINPVINLFISTIVNNSIMSFLADTHLEIKSNSEWQMEKDYRSAYMTIISFLKFVDNGSSFTEKFLKDRFSHRLHYRIMLDKMISHSILKKSGKDNYILNIESNNQISSIFDHSLFSTNKNRHNQNSDFSSSTFIHKILNWIIIKILLLSIVVTFSVLNDFDFHLIFSLL